MNEEETEIYVSRVIEAPVTAVFNLLVHPARHREFDGSGMVVADEQARVLQAVGDTFTMNMHHESQGGDYQMENHVVAYAEHQLIGWAPARPGEKPAGWKWVYMIDELGPNATRVTLTYDWTNVEDSELAATFPAIPRESLEKSLKLLAEAVA